MMGFAALDPSYGHGGVGLGAGQEQDYEGVGVVTPLALVAEAEDLLELVHHQQESRPGGEIALGHRLPEPESPTAQGAFQKSGGIGRTGALATQGLWGKEGRREGSEGITAGEHDGYAPVRRLRC